MGLIKAGLGAAGGVWKCLCGATATGTTGTLIMGETGLKITRMKSGPRGGD